MAYVTISTWKMNTSDYDADALWRAMQEKYMPGVRAMGADHAMVVETGDGESAIIATYPDQATRDAAEEKIAAMRAQGASEFDTTMTGELKGEVRASTG